MTKEELDAECETYLEKRFGEKVDFAIECSLPGLLADGLIQQAGEAKPLLPISHLIRNPFLSFASCSVFVRVFLIGYVSWAKVDVTAVLNLLHVFSVFYMRSMQ
jgi:hypothetical protein